MSAVINPGEARPTLGPLTTTTGFTSLYIPTARPWLRPMTKANLCANVRPHMQLGIKSGSKSTLLVVVSGSGDVLSSLTKGGSHSDRGLPR